MSNRISGLIRYHIFSIYYSSNLDGEREKEKDMLDEENKDSPNRSKDKSKKKHKDE